MKQAYVRKYIQIIIPPMFKSQEVQMDKNRQRLLNAIIIAGTVFGSTAAFADSKIVPGTIDPCQQLPLAVAPNNDTDTNPDTGVCVDVPVKLTKVKVVFNLDNTIVDGAGNSVGLKHMAMLAGVLKRSMMNGEISADDISIVGLMHGEAMTVGKWAFKAAPSNIKDQIDVLFAFANDPSYPVHIQLEACGTTIKGMQKNGAMVPDGAGGTVPMDEKFVYPGILVNQGAIGRLIDLEQNKYVYVQED